MGLNMELPLSSVWRAAAVTSLSVDFLLLYFATLLLARGNLSNAVCFEQTCLEYGGGTASKHFSIPGDVVWGFTLQGLSSWPPLRCNRCVSLMQEKGKNQVSGYLFSIYLQLGGKRFLKHCRVFVCLVFVVTSHSGEQCCALCWVKITHWSALWSSDTSDLNTDFWEAALCFHILVLLLTVPGMEEATSEADKALSKQGWDTKKVGISYFKVQSFHFLNIFR